MKTSVVLAVYNGAASIERSLDSIRGQTETDFELIVVDDGSTDQTPSILASYAERDARVRVITQPNAGLTRALIAGCRAARGAFIARHDAGDVSHPDRFRLQREAIESAADIVLVASSTRFYAPGGETLFIATADGEEVRRSLLSENLASIRSLPSHPCVMFRRNAYDEVGGYREEFYFAQDFDLWLRLARKGRFVILPDVLYEAAFEPNAISGRHREDQMRLASIALALRDATPEESAALLRAAADARNTTRLTSRQRGRALYFIGRCLQQQGNAAAGRYLREALRSDPFYWRTWMAFLRRRGPRVTR